MASRDRRASKSEKTRYQEMLDRAVPPVPGSGALYRGDLPLSNLKPGECGTVLRLNGIFCGRLRLLEMGLTPGTHVRMVRAAAFGGPVDIEVRGYQLSLRREEAAAVWLGDEDRP
jgi:ferrous iron transport protein A